MISCAISFFFFVSCCIIHMHGIRSRKYPQCFVEHLCFKSQYVSNHRHVTFSLLVAWHKKCASVGACICFHMSYGFAISFLTNACFPVFFRLMKYLVQSCISHAIEIRFCMYGFEMCPSMFQRHTPCQFVSLWVYIYACLTRTFGRVYQFVFTDVYMQMFAQEWYMACKMLQ